MQFNSSESELHPFIATARLRLGEDSVDNTADNLHHGASVQRVVQGGRTAPGVADQEPVALPPPC